MNKLREAMIRMTGNPRRAIVTAMRLALGALLINASLFVIIHYIDLLIPNTANGEFTSALVNSKILYLAKVVEFSVGVLLICNIFVPLALVMILPVSIIFCWVDYLLDPQPSSIAACTVIAGLNVALLFFHLPYYRSMLVRRTDGTTTPGWRLGEKMAVVLGLAGAIFFATTIARDPDFRKPVPAAGEPIKIGKTGDLSGDGALSTQVQEKFFEALNARGGIEGRPVVMVALDDRGSSRQAVLNVRRLAAMKDVAALLDSETDVTAREVRNAAAQFRVPSLFSDVNVPDGADAMAGGWSMGFLPDRYGEARLLLALAAREARGGPVVLLVPPDWAGGEDASNLRVSPLIRNIRVAKIGDEAGLESVASFIRLPGGKAAGALVLSLDPDMTAHVLAAVRKSGWRGPVLLSSRAATKLDAKQLDMPSLRIFSIRYYKDGHDPAWSKLKPLEFQMWPKWDSDRRIQAYTTFLRENVPGADPKDPAVVAAYSHAEILAAVLQRAIDNPGRATIMRQAQRLHGAEMSLMTPGVIPYTGPERARPISQGQPIVRRDGHWIEAGKLVDTDIAF